MKPMTGTISIFIDLDKARAYHDLGFRVLCLTDDKSVMAGMQNAMMCSILLPPYDAMNALLDGDTMGFNSIYGEYLEQSVEANVLISIILAALYQGVNMILYVPVNEFNLGFIQTLLNYIGYQTGIVLGFDDSVGFAYNPQYNDVNMFRLYKDGLLTYPDLLVGIDQNIVDPNTCLKVCMDIGFCPKDPGEAIEYVNKYLANIRANNNVFLKKGFIPE